MILADSTDFEYKKQGIFYNINSGLAYPLTYEEMHQLSKSNQDTDFYYLAELLNKNVYTFQHSEEATQFTYKLLIPVLRRGYLDGEMLQGSRINNIQNSGLVECIFYACCRMVIAPKDGKIAEEKLAKLLVALAFNFKDIPTLRPLIFALFREFITGHFLDFNSVNDYAEKITTEWVSSKVK
jgi:hypothetical protein